MYPLLQIAIGGAIGASCRHLLGQKVSRLLGLGFPWPTLSVNILGCLIMGVLAAVFVRGGAPALHPLAPLLMTGLLGGFTTFSAFSLDVWLLVERGRSDLAGLYVLASVGLSLGAFLVGHGLVRAVQA